MTTYYASHNKAFVAVDCIIFGFDAVVENGRFMEVSWAVMKVLTKPLTACFTSLRV